MTNRPEFLEFDVGGATLGALAWPGRLGVPTVIAAHGITANAWSWDPLAHALNGAARLIAVDLRGRGRSYGQQGPFGMRQHADDLAQIADQVGAPVGLIGHSMGAFAVLMAAERHPARFDQLVAVDGGTPLPRPAGDIDAALDQGLGPAIARIRTVWPDRVSYRTMWSQHPAFAGGLGPELERNLLADLIEVEGGFRTAVDEAAVRHDGAELLTDEEVRTVLDRRQGPLTIVRAGLGMFGAPPPLIDDDARRRYSQHRWVEAGQLNHYTVLNSAAGAALVADTLLATLAG